MRKVLFLISMIAVLAGLGAWVPPAQSADTGNPAPQPGMIVSDEPGQNAPNILDGSAFSVAKVGNTIVVGGLFTQAQNHGSSTTVTRKSQRPMFRGTRVPRSGREARLHAGRRLTR